MEMSCNNIPQTYCSSMSIVIFPYARSSSWNIFNAIFFSFISSTEVPFKFFFFFPPQSPFVELEIHDSYDKKLVKNKERIFLKIWDVFCYLALLSFHYFVMISELRPLLLNEQENCWERACFWFVLSTCYEMFYQKRRT